MENKQSHRNIFLNCVYSHIILQVQRPFPFTTIPFCLFGTKVVLVTGRHRYIWKELWKPRNYTQAGPRNDTLKRTAASIVDLKQWTNKAFFFLWKACCETFTTSNWTMYLPTANKKIRKFLFMGIVILINIIKITTKLYNHKKQINVVLF